MFPISFAFNGCAEDPSREGGGEHKEQFVRGGTPAQTTFNLDEKDNRVEKLQKSKIVALVHENDQSV